MSKLTEREGNLLNKYVARGFTIPQAKRLISAVKNHQPVFGLIGSFGRAFFHGKWHLKKRGFKS
jgi:hypothetical protein